MDGDKDFLYRQLIKLGDMMGDGLHHEADGKWISREYKRVAKALGIIPKQNHAVRIAAINERMKVRVIEAKCTVCQGELKQTKSGSKRARCIQCKALFGLLK